mgnify:CR=1 FL=1
MSVIYGNSAFLGVINVVTNEIGRNGPRVSASYGSRDSGRLFARAGTATEGEQRTNAPALVVAALGDGLRDALSGAELDERLRSNRSGN